MGFTYPLTYQRSWSRFWSSNSTYSSALTGKSSKADVLSTNVQNPEAGLVALSSATTGRAIVPCGPGALVLAQFVGTNADNQTFSGRVWSWRYIESDGVTCQWTATCICDLALTLCAKTGISGGLFANTAFYADTIGVSTDRNAVTASRVVGVAGGDDSPAMLVVDPLGAEFIEFELTNSGGTAVSFNGMFSATSGV